MILKAPLVMTVFFLFSIRLSGSEKDGEVSGGALHFLSENFTKCPKFRTKKFENKIFVRIFFQKPLVNFKTLKF